MRLCPNCGNPNDDTGKYCICCGSSMDHARPEIPADQLRPEMPVYEDQLRPEMPVYEDQLRPEMPVYDEHVSTGTPDQPLWVTEQYDLSSENDLEKSLLYRSPDQSTDAADILSAAQKYAVNFDEYTPDADDVDIFDEVADTASLLFSNMPPKVKKVMIAFLIGTLLSIIPFIYVSCSHQGKTTPGNFTGVTTSQKTP